MSWDTALMGIGAGLEGGLRGFEWLQDQKARDADRAEQRAWRQWQQQQAQQEAEQRLRAERRKLIADLIVDTGAGGRVAPDVAEEAAALGLGHRVTAPTLPSRSFQGYQEAPQGAMVGAFVDRPSTSFVEPTGAERAQQAEADRTRRALNSARAGLPEHLLPVFDYGAATGKPPAFRPEDYVTPEVAEAASTKKAESSFQDFARRERFKASQRPNPVVDKEAKLRAEGERAYRLEIERLKAINAIKGRGRGSALDRLLAGEDDAAPGAQQSQEEDEEELLGSFEDWFPGWRAARDPDDDADDVAPDDVPGAQPARPALEALGLRPMPSHAQRGTAAAATPPLAQRPPVKAGASRSEAALEQRARRLMAEITRLDRAGQGAKAGSLRRELAQLLEE